MRLRVDVSKNFSTAASSQEGEFDTSTTTEAPFSASASPSPVRLLTPELGDAATVSRPCSRSLLTSFDPMSPVPPITTIFIILLSWLTHAFRRILPTRVSSLREPDSGRTCSGDYCRRQYCSQYHIARFFLRAPFAP